LTKEIVLLEFSRISGISVNKLNENERERLVNLETNLTKRIFGQDEACAKIANAVKIAKVGRRNGGKPQAAFLLLGPSGTGKTEMSKALTQALLDDEKALTRFDMSEYMEKHAVAKLIGAPPGYEGFEVGGLLTNIMRKNPIQILLFDEIEKANDDVFNIFLQILSDGRLTDNIGRVVSFADAIIIMTTNIGQPYFLNQDLSPEQSRAGALEELSARYRPEFLNRFAGRENIIPFNRLELDSIERIVRREINDLNKAYLDSGIQVNIEEPQLKAFCIDRYDPTAGARGLPGFIQANLEPVIANIVLEGGPTGTLNVSYNKTTKKFETQLAVV
jgi:ATP-dependent Clp protease ATP-binding subunit ClpA